MLGGWAEQDGRGGDEIAAPGPASSSFEKDFFSRSAASETRNASSDEVSFSRMLLKGLAILFAFRLVLDVFNLSLDSLPSLSMQKTTTSSIDNVKSAEAMAAGSIIKDLSDSWQAQQELHERIQREKVAWKEEQDRMAAEAKATKEIEKIRKKMEKERNLWEKENSKREKLRKKHEAMKKAEDEKWKKEKERTSQVIGEKNEQESFVETKKE